MITTAEVEQELAVQLKNEKQTNTVQNIVLLVVSLIIFGGTGLIDKSPSTIITIIAIVFIHELGHWAGMLIFGYRDVRMFFIPFFGAAVSGKSENVSGGRRAVVILLGPCPGIILGTISLLVYWNTHQQIYLTYGTSSIFINGFNLIPFSPLDGGRLLEIVLFSRNAKVEAAFRLVAAIGLGCIAWLFKSIPLGIVSVFALIVIRENYLRSRLAFELQKLSRDNPVEPNARIPTSWIEAILPRLSTGLPEARITAKLLARRAHSIWIRFSQRPPRVWSSIALLAIYLVFCLSVPVGAVLYYKVTQKTVVTSEMDPSGRTVRLVQTYQTNHKIFECPINRSGFYDGHSTAWSSNGQKRKEGAWMNGYANGEWKFYDYNGNLTCIVTYDRGRPVKCMRSQEGVLVEIEPDKWPFSVRPSSQRKPVQIPKP